MYIPQMNKILISLLCISVSIQAEAAQNILWISNTKLREWDITIDDIPTAIKSAIDFFMGIAGTIAVIFVIIWAYKILFGSLQQDKTKWRDTIIMALWGFALAALAWMIIQILIVNLW